MLTAHDHIARLQCFFPHLFKMSKQKRKAQLIIELREFRKDTSWLIHQLEANKCKC